MTDAASTAVPTRRKKGKGERVAPAIVFNGSNIPSDPQQKRGRGRPPGSGIIHEFTEEVADRICDWRAEGRSLNSYCNQEGAPDSRTVYRWLDANAEFSRNYARACDEGTDRLVEIGLDELSNPNLPPDQVQRVWRSFEARKWYVSKIAPKRYGDKLDVRREITGPGGGPIQVDVLLNVLLTPANLERLTDIEVESIRSAAAKLALPPAASAAPPTIDADYTDVPPDGAGDG